MPDHGLARLPMFPLNAVVFPGATVPLFVFEQRYRALMQHLRGIDDPELRFFGTVAIREGYEVGPHAKQSLYRTGCRLLLQRAHEAEDGTWQVEAQAVGRIRVHDFDAGAAFPVASVSDLEEDVVREAGDIFLRVVDVADAYRNELADLGAAPWPEGFTELFRQATPATTAHLTWRLCDRAPLPIAERQSLLDETDVIERLSHLESLLRTEVRAMKAVPSLPATQLARTRWSPN